MLWPWQLWLRDTPEQKFAPAVPHTHRRGACILREFLLAPCSLQGSYAPQQLADYFFPHDSRAAPQTVQTAFPVCGTDGKLSSVALGIIPFLRTHLVFPCQSSECLAIHSAACCSVAEPLTTSVSPSGKEHRPPSQIRDYLFAPRKRVGIRTSREYAPTARRFNPVV